MTTIVPGSLARTDRPDCQSASPDSSGQEQGGVGGSVHTLAIAWVVAGPEGPRGQAPSVTPLSSLEHIANNYGIFRVVNSFAIGAILRARGWPGWPSVHSSGMPALRRPAK